MMSVFSETDIVTSITLSLSSSSSLHDTIPIAEMITTSNVEKDNPKSQEECKPYFFRSPKFYRTVIIGYHDSFPYFCRGKPDIY